MGRFARPENADDFNGRVGDQEEEYIELLHKLRSSLMSHFFASTIYLEIIVVKKKKRISCASVLTFWAGYFDEEKRSKHHEADLKPTKPK